MQGIQAESEEVNFLFLRNTFDMKEGGHFCLAGSDGEFSPSWQSLIGSKPRLVRVKIRASSRANEIPYFCH